MAFGPESAVAGVLGGETGRFAPDPGVAADEEEVLGRSPSVRHCEQSFPGALLRPAAPTMPPRAGSSTSPAKDLKVWRAVARIHHAGVEWVPWPSDRDVGLTTHSSVHS